MREKERETETETERQTDREHELSKKNHEVSEIPCHFIFQVSLDTH